MTKDSTILSEGSLQGSNTDGQMKCERFSFVDSILSMSKIGLRSDTRNNVPIIFFQEVFKDSVSFEKFCSYLQRLQSPSREFIQLLFDWVGILKLAIGLLSN